MAFPLPCYDFLKLLGKEMKPYILGVWIVGITFESVLLARAFLTQWFRAYPLFSAYLLCVFIQDIFFLSVYLFHFKYYAPIYWYAEFFSLLLGCAVTWEIFRLVLGRYPGAGRMARNVLLFALILVITKHLGEASAGVPTWPTTAVELERNLRGIQAVSLIVLAFLSVYYMIPIGSNIRGIFAGYGLFVATSVITLTLRTSLGSAFQTGWTFLQPLSYIVVLAIWCSSLWEYQLASTTELPAKIEQDYQSLAMATRKGLVQARAFLGKSLRP